MTQCPKCGYEEPKPEYEYSGYLAPFLPTILPLLRGGYTPAEIRDMLFEAHGAKACSSQWGTDPTAMIAVIGRRYGITKPGPQNVEDRKRSRQIAKRRANGETYRSIAAALNISPERVRGIAMREERRAEKAEQQQHARAVAPTIDDIPLDVLELSTRLHNCLRNENCKSVGDVRKLCKVSDAWLLRIPNFGRVSLYEWQKCLSRLLADNEIAAE